jgi:hypothetical protein
LDKNKPLNENINRIKELLWTRKHY